MPYTHALAYIFYVLGQINAGMPLYEVYLSFDACHEGDLMGALFQNAYLQCLHGLYRIFLCVHDITANYNCNQLIFED